MESMYKLLDVTKNILHDRQENYGCPACSLQETADMWADYLQYPIQPHNVASMMIMLKLQRAKDNGGYIDNWIDIAGYAAMAGGYASTISDTQHHDEDQQSTELDSEDSHLEDL